MANRIQKQIMIDFDINKRLLRERTNVSGLIHNLLVDYFIKVDNSTEKGLLLNLRAKYKEIETMKTDINQLADKLEQMTGKTVTRIETEVKTNAK